MIGSFVPMKAVVDTMVDHIAATWHEQSPVSPIVTARIGAGTMYPENDASEAGLVRAADALLYRAKQSGRNRMAYQEQSGVGAD